MSLNQLQNVYFNALVSNVRTISVQSQALTTWTNATNKLQSNWLNGEMPTSAVKPDGSIGNPAADFDLLKRTTSGKDQERAISTFMTNYMTAKNLSRFSNSAVNLVMIQLNTCFENDLGPPLLGSLNNFMSIVTSESTKELTTGQTAIKSQGSIIQQSSSIQQPLSDAANSLGTLFGLIAEQLNKGKSF